jgi:hypothetical protein
VSYLEPINVAAKPKLAESCIIDNNMSIKAYIEKITKK